MAHEYFHNWTGDRVTCRDWFQLTLKEGLTVFRDQQFSADMHSAAVKRISDVVLLRDGQFPEDAGPLAHPIRPRRYIEINNFYTRTVYEKGAEVIRMIHTLIGPEAFRKGIDLYFERHDGQAVTCEDFVAAMADASGRDLSQFMRWYGQAGTPELTVARNYDPAAALHARGQPAHPAHPRPAGEAAAPHPPARRPRRPRRERAAAPARGGERAQGHRPRDRADRAQPALHLPRREAEPVPSLLRGFSAPVKLDAGYAEDELAFLLARDSDPFVRWDAGQTLSLRALLRLIEGRRSGAEPAFDPRLPESFAVVLERAAEDRAFAARALQLPSGTYLGQQMAEIDVDGIAFALRLARGQLGGVLRERWLAAYRDNQPEGPFSIETAAMARRALKNTALAYLAYARDPEGQELVRRQLADADNMTDSLTALGPAETGDAGIGRGAGRLLRALAGRAAGGQQVVRAPGDAGGRGERRADRAPDGPPGLHAHQPEPRPLGARHVRGDEPARLPPQGRRRLPPPGRQGRRGRPPEPAGRRPPAHRLQPLAPLRHGRQALMRAELERVSATPGLSRTATRSRASRWRGDGPGRKSVRRGPKRLRRTGPGYFSTVSEVSSRRQELPPPAAWAVIVTECAPAVGTTKVDWRSAPT